MKAETYGLRNRHSGLTPESPRTDPREPWGSNPLGPPGPELEVLSPELLRGPELRVSRTFLDQLRPQLFRPWIPNSRRCQHFLSSLGPFLAA